MTSRCRVGCSLVGLLLAVAPSPGNAVDSPRRIFYETVGERTYFPLDDQAVSASFNLPVAELKQRLQGFIRSFPTSMEWPGLSGMLGIEAPETKEKGASVRAIALRCGAGVLPTTSWAVVRVLKEKSLLTSAGCECPSRDDVREESKMAFDRMVAAIGAAPSTPLKRPVHPEHLPAFTPDAPPDVDWSDVGILRLLRQSLRTRGNFPAGGVLLDWQEPGPRPTHRGGTS